MGNLKLLSMVANFGRKHQVAIRTISIASSTIMAVYFAIKDTPKMMAELEELDARGASNLEKAKSVASNMSRTAAATATSVGLTVFSGVQAASIITGMSEGYALLKASKDEYIAHTEKIVGAEKAAEIKRSIAESKFPIEDGGGNYLPSQKVYRTGRGDDLFKLEFTDDWFTSNILYLKNLGINTKEAILGGTDLLLNELALDIGVPSRNANKYLHWTDEMLRYYNCHENLFKFEPGMTDDDRVYTIVSFDVDPEPIGRRRW